MAHMGGGERVWGGRGGHLLRTMADWKVDTESLIEFYATHIRRMFEVVMRGKRNTSAVALKVPLLHPAVFHTWFNSKHRASLAPRTTPTGLHKLSLAPGQQGELEFLLGEGWTRFTVHLASGATDGYYELNPYKTINVVYNETKASLSISFNFTRYNDHGVPQY